MINHMLKEYHLHHMVKREVWLWADRSVPVRPSLECLYTFYKFLSVEWSWPRDDMESIVPDVVTDSPAVSCNGRLSCNKWNRNYSMLPISDMNTSNLSTLFTSAYEIQRIWKKPVSPSKTLNKYPLFPKSEPKPLIQNSTNKQKNHRLVTWYVLQDQSTGQSDS